ncbi:hypothetical protein [Alicyclobacillus fastidiosus]|uniref:Uncharacterized protein n=1 Tax=Alicyclobacillus fastidiosus TaxID=392011 RepID=A0ABV5AKI3_9BACL|nr:hypothetical protein [Alicyclobacillus fastidiosus]WEH09291.1 hypothetical protein PYS47_21885 [Alicyclobacillus fastidiosus]
MDKNLQWANDTYERIQREWQVRMLGEQAVRDREEEQMYQAFLKRLIRDGYVKQDGDK